MGSLEFLYGTAFGRVLLKPLASRPLSVVCGKFLDTKLSKLLIKGFVKRNGIDLDDYDVSGVRSFNDFFCRPIKPGRRPIDPDPVSLIAPCDGLLTVYPINGDTVYPVKQSTYDIKTLLGDEELAASFEGGTCLVFRLCVNHFHRYCWFDSGTKGENRFIKGVLHTVRPVALAKRPVFVENCREYTVVESDLFGKAVQMEVGAMLVGKIVNDEKGSAQVVRGSEKGHFEYGGSTIIVLLQKDAASIRSDIMSASADGVETPVRMGEAIGKGMESK